MIWSTWQGQRGRVIFLIPLIMLLWLRRRILLTQQSLYTTESPLRFSLPVSIVLLRLVSWQKPLLQKILQSGQKGSSRQLLPPSQSWDSLVQTHWRWFVTEQYHLLKLPQATQLGIYPNLKSHFCMAFSQIMKLSLKSTPLFKVTQISSFKTTQAVVRSLVGCGFPVETISFSVETRQKRQPISKGKRCVATARLFLTGLKHLAPRLSSQRSQRFIRLQNAGSWTVV